MWLGDAVGYHGVHKRLIKQLGSASFQRCVDCLGWASQWSYDRTDPRECASRFGPYSRDPSRYQPRCAACHKAYDVKKIRELGQAPWYRREKS